MIPSSVRPHPILGGPTQSGRRTTMAPLLVGLRRKTLAADDDDARSVAQSSGSRTNLVGTGERSGVCLQATPDINRWIGSENCR